MTASIRTSAGPVPWPDHTPKFCVGSVLRKPEEAPALKRKRALSPREANPSTVTISRETFGALIQIAIMAKGAFLERKRTSVRRFREALAVLPEEMLP